jgi:hypothetical protein
MEFGRPAPNPLGFLTFLNLDVNLNLNRDVPFQAATGIKIEIKRKIKIKMREFRGAHNSLLKNSRSAAWGHAAYRNSIECEAPCRPGALTGRVFQQADKDSNSKPSSLKTGQLASLPSHS